MQAAAPASSVAGANACRQTSTCLPCSTRVARTASTRRRPPAWRTSPTAPPSPCAISPTRPWRCSATSRRGAGLRNRPAPGKRRRAAAPPVRLRPSGTAPATRRRIAPRRRGGAAGDVRRQGRQRATRRTPTCARCSCRSCAPTTRRSRPTDGAAHRPWPAPSTSSSASTTKSAPPRRRPGATPAGLPPGCGAPGGHFPERERDAVIEHLLRRLAHPDALSREVA